VRAFAAGMRLQWSLFRRSPGQLLVFATVPFFTAIFLAGIRHAGRQDLAAYAVLAPVLIALWVVSLDLAGSIIDDERALYTFELLVAAPSSIALVLAGRIATVTLLGSTAFVEAPLVAALCFGVTVEVAHSATFALTLVATLLAMAGTSTAMAAAFVAARSARRFANAMGYPFYILGGLVIPISMLPDWLRPLSWLIYLYWSADLLRDSTEAEPVRHVAWRLAVLLVLGVVAYLAGLWLTRRIVDGLRGNGTVGLS
jgi:ABC-2 type transport system permease protein